MAQGISPNPLNDISKAYLDLVHKINKDEEEKIVQNWDNTSVNKVDPDLVLKVEDKQYGYDKKGRSLNPVDIEKRKRKDDDLFGSPKKKAKIKTQESFSDWRDDLREIVSEPEEKAEKEVKEKKGIKNKVVINPKLGEAVQEMGGQLLQIQEIVADEDPSMKSKQNRQKQIKRQVLLKKLQAVRQGGGEDITASYNLIDAATDYLYEEGLNEEGIDLLIEEIGLDGFVEFIEGPIVELNEAEEGRPAKKASVRAKKYDVVKKEVDKADAARKASKKGEYAPSYAKKETDVTDYGDDKPAAKKAPAGMKKAVARKKEVLKQPVKKVAPKPVAKKVQKVVAKVKTTQPTKRVKASKEVVKKGIRAKVKSLYDAGKKRHRKATQPIRVFGKGVRRGVGDTVKFAKKAKKALVGEKFDYDPMDDPDFVPREAEKKRGVSGKNNPKGGKKLKDLTKEEFSNWRGDLVEKDLTAAERRALPNKDFALPGKGEGPKGKQAGSYPIPDEKHARSALSLVSQHGTPAEKATVRAKVKKKFPNIDVSEAVKGQDTETRKAMSSERKSGDKRLSPSEGKANADKMERDVKFFDKLTKKAKHTPGSMDESRDRAVDIVRQDIIKKHGKGAIYDPKRDKPTDAQKKAAAAERQKRQAEKNKAFADRAKKAGYKSTQDYANVVARYGSEDNMKKGKGLGT